MSERANTDKQLRKDVAATASLGAYMGILLFLVDGSMQFSHLFYSYEPIIYIFVTGLCAMIVCGLVFAFRGALSVSIECKNLGVKAGLAATTGFATCLIVTNLHLPPLLSIASSALFGAGLAAIGIGTCFELTNDPPYRILRKLAIAGIIASLLKMTLLSLPASWLGPALVVLLAASSYMPRTMRTSRPIADDRTGTVVDLTRGLFERNWVFFAGLIISTVLGTLMWKGLIVGDYTGYVPEPESQLGSVIGSLLASILLLVLSRDSSLKRLGSITPIVPLFCIAAILLTWFIGIWDEGLNILGDYGSHYNELLGNIPVGFSTLIISALLIRRIVDELHLGLSPAFAFGLLAALLAAFFLLYTALQLVLIWESSRAVDLLLKVAYLVAAAGYLFTLTQKSTVKPTLPLDRQIEEVQERFALSHRETEMLSLLTQGRSAPYIAEAEHIALSTVKTHIKRIYAKTGVHNREELLDIVYSMEDDRGL